MLKQHITHLILDMIGDGKRDYKLDDGNIITAVTMPYIREKVPELTDTIVNMIVEEIEEYANSQSDKTVAMGIIGTISLLKD